MKFNSVDEILEFAIQREQRAADFYTGLAERSDFKNIKQVFLGFAEEEKGHKAKLESVKKGAVVLADGQKVQDLKIGDNLVDVNFDDTNISYQDALLLAMKAEKMAFRLYHSLSVATDDSGLKELFLGLAQEEAKHKLRFEVEYDDIILDEN
ncbi:MAG: ferritin family protein [candidate division Zixibacteria bacterium]|nr:ferritin family protein [candidate division Zixibacteria bacterium]